LNLDARGLLANLRQLQVIGNLPFGITDFARPARGQVYSSLVAPLEDG
jgi:hypothetical protein